MVNFNDEIAKLHRHPGWIFALYLDRCSLEYGISPCAASGTPYCYYTWKTCKDPTNFVRDNSPVYYCENAGRWDKNALPFIKRISYNSLEIDPKSMKTTRGDLVITLHDDLPGPIANPGKLLSNTETGGSYWRNLLARSPNYYRRLGELFLTVGPPEDMEYRFSNMGTNFSLPTDRFCILIKGDNCWYSGFEALILWTYATTQEIALEIWSIDGTLHQPLSLLMECKNTFKKPAGVFEYVPSVFVFDEPIFMNTEEPLAFVFRNLGPNQAVSLRGSGYVPLSGWCHRTYGVSPCLASGGSCEHSWNTCYDHTQQTPFNSGWHKDYQNPTVWGADFGTNCKMPYFVLKKRYDKLFFRGMIEKIVSKVGEVEITLKDIMKSLDGKSHLKQSENCTNQWAYTNQTTMRITKVRELEPYGVLLSSDSGLMVKYGSWEADSIDDECGTLYDVSFAFGSSGTIVAGERMFQVLPYSRDDNGFDDGLPPDMIMMDLICNRGKISSSYIQTVDSETTLSADLSVDGTSISVVDGDSLPACGIIKIDLEFIVYCGKDAADKNVLVTSGGTGDVPIFRDHLRGAFGTTKAAHDSGSKVYITAFGREALSWMNGMLFSALYQEPQKVQDIVNTFCEQTMSQCFQNEEGFIDFKALTPPKPSEVISELGDEQHFTLGSPELTYDTELQKTRIEIYYNSLTLPADPGTTPDNYDSYLLDIRSDIEDENYLNGVRLKTIFANFIYREEEALALAGRYVALYAEGVSLLDFDVELKDYSVQIGQYIKAATAQIVDETGAATTKYFEIIQKKPVNTSKFHMRGIEYNFIGIVGLIAPADPTLETTIDDNDTTVTLQLVSTTGAGDLENDTFLNEHFLDSGQIRIEDEKISYAAKSYDAGTKKLTLTGCGRGILTTSAAAHTSGANVLLLYSGASEAAISRWAWISDADGKLDRDGDGINEADGYIIW